MTGALLYDAGVLLLWYILDWMRPSTPMRYGLMGALLVTTPLDWYMIPPYFPLLICCYGAATETDTDTDTETATTEAQLDPVHHDILVPCTTHQGRTR